MMHRFVRDRRGQAMVEYALLVAGIALISAAAVSVLGYKTSGLIAAMAAVMPGASSASNGPISSGHLIETTAGTSLTGIALDVAKINSPGTGTARLGINVLGSDSTGNFGNLVLDNTP
jgi:pilus assembly protein Flp/PilA